MTTYYFGSGCDCPECMPQKRGSEDVQRCGFCGRYFLGLNYLSEDEVKTLLHYGEEIPLGYCPNAIREAEEQDLSQ